MSMRAPKNEMTDRERILAYLLSEVMYEVVFGGQRPGGSRTWRYSEPGEPVAGQIVFATTSGTRRPHPHAFGECVGREDPGAKFNERDVPLIRAFGDPAEKAVRFFNESFYIRTEPTTAFETALLEGWQHAYYERLMRARKRAGDGYLYRFAGLKFHTNGRATMSVRPHIFIESLGKQPFDIDLPATPKTLQREIVDALVAGGYGTRFE